MTYFQPLLPSIVVIIALTSWLIRKSPRAWLLQLVAISLFLVTFQPFAWLVLYPFEQRYSKSLPDPRGAEAIVVLSSSVFGPSPPRAADILGPDTYERCIYAAELYRRKPMPVVASGGGSRGGVPYAAVMARELARQGIAPEFIWTEEQSSSTHENAEESAKILRSKGIQRILLVTEAYHMPRAEKCFRKAGLTVTAAPCGFRIDFHGSFRDFVPVGQALTWNEESLHEYVGLLWYQYKGWI